MFARLPRLFWIECTLAVAAALASALSLLSPRWIEMMSDFDPDSRGGLVEHLIVVAFAASFLILSWAARHNWRAARRRWLVACQAEGDRVG